MECGDSLNPTLVRYATLTPIPDQVIRLDFFALAHYPRLPPDSNFGFHLVTGGDL